MTRQEFEYIKRAMEALEGTLTLPSRIKITRTMSQILARDADIMEQELVDKVELRLYNKDTEKLGASDV
jgi:hypothetical protein